MPSLTRATCILAAMVLNLTACADAPATKGNVLIPPTALVTAPPPSPIPSPIASHIPAPTGARSAASLTLVPLELPALACELNWQFPAHGVKLEPRTGFTAQWNVTNTGAAAWDPAAIELIYTHGTRMILGSPAALPQRIEPGQSVTLAVEMMAPRNSSGYITNVALRQADALFCSLSVSVLVVTDDNAG